MVGDRNKAARTLNQCFGEGINRLPSLNLDFDVYQQICSCSALVGRYRWGDRHPPQARGKKGNAIAPTDITKGDRFLLLEGDRLTQE